MTYTCSEEQKREKEHPEEESLCLRCSLFMDEADCCLEDSLLTPLMYELGQKTEPCHFIDFNKVVSSKEESKP